MNCEICQEQHSSTILLRMEDNSEIPLAYLCNKCAERAMSSLENILKSMPLSTLNLILQDNDQSITFPSPVILSGFLADEFIVGFTQHQPKLVPGRYSLSVNGEQISSMYVYNVQEGIQAENGILIFVYRLSLGAVK